MHENYDAEFNRLAGPKHYPARLGIIGGGQLARMTAIAALPLGVEVVRARSSARRDYFVSRYACRISAATSSQMAGVSGPEVLVQISSAKRFFGAAQATA